MVEVDFTDRVAHCLLMLNAAGERAELLNAGVAPKRVATLYPPDIELLYPALNAYLDSGRRVEFPSPGAMYEVRQESQRLRDLAEVSAAPAAVEEALSKLTLLGGQAAGRIVDYPNVLIGAGQGAPYIQQRAHIRLGLSYLERAFWYAAVCDIKDQRRVGIHLLRTTRRLLPELLTPDL